MKVNLFKLPIPCFQLSAFSFQPTLFAFYLLPFSILFSSCQFNPAIQGKGTDFLQGEWHQDTVLHKERLLEYTTHRFVFTCDSFYAMLNTFARVNRQGSEKCFDKGRWTEYAKGNYAVRNDTLYVIATFTQSNFKQKISGCYRIGRYLPVFVFKKRSENEVQLLDLQRHLPVILQRKKKTNCNPKSL